MTDELPDRLRATAQEYEPDRDRMWSRVSEGMREPRASVEPVRTGWRIPQLGLATGVAVVLIGAIVFFGHAMGLGPRIGPTPEPPAAGPGTRSASASDPASGEDTPSEPAETTGGGEETHGGSSPEVDAGPDWVSIDGTVDPGGNAYWSQSNLVLENQETLAGLTVELRVAQGDGLVHTGAWSTDDSRFEQAVVTEEDGFLVYRWTLKDGAVLPPGRYTLAAQFNHESGARSADDDRFRFEGETESGEQGEIEGDFA